MDINSTKTVKGISQELEELNLDNDLYTMIAKKANEQIKIWFPALDVKAIILEQNEVLQW